MPIRIWVKGTEATLCDRGWARVCAEIAEGEAYGLTSRTNLAVVIDLATAHGRDTLTHWIPDHALGEQAAGVIVVIVKRQSFLDEFLAERGSVTALDPNRWTVAFVLPDHGFSLRYLPESKTS